MSFVVTVPELLEAAAGRLHVIGSAVSAANVTAAFPITGVIPAAADEVSAVTAAAFSGYGQLYQAISAEAGLIHDEFVRALGLGANSYAATEAANAAQAGGVRVAHVAPPRMAPTAPARMTHVAPPRPAPTPPATPAFGATSAGRASYGGGYGGGRPATHGGGYAGGNYGGGRVDPYARFSYGGHTAPYAGGYGAHAAPAAPAHPAPAHPAPAAPAHPAPTQHAPAAPASPTTAPAMPAQPVTVQPAPNYPGTVQPEHYVPAYPSPAGPTRALPARA